jgi:Domain of unknown function (DUF4386)
MNYRRIATFTGWLWIITFVTSIPARFFFYALVLDNQGNYVTGAGSDARMLIAIGIDRTAPHHLQRRDGRGAVLDPQARARSGRRRLRDGAPVECTFIAIGIVGMLAISTLRQDAVSGTSAAVGQGLFAVYEWAFRIGPGVLVGVGNGLILGWLMFRSGLVPPRLAIFGLVGGRSSSSREPWSSWASSRPVARSRR